MTQILLKSIDFSKYLCYNNTNKAIGGVFTQYFKKALSLTAALTLLTYGTAVRFPQPIDCGSDAAQIQQFIASLSALTTPDEPFETLRYDVNEQQLYCDGKPVGQCYGGFSVHDGTVTVSAQSLGIEEQAELSPEQAAAHAGIAYTEDADGLTFRAPFHSSRLILRCEGEPQQSELAESISDYQDLHVLQYRSSAEAYAAYQRYQADNSVSLVQPDQIYHADVQCCAIPNADKDPAVGYIGADVFCEQLQSEHETLPEITVAILDTGLYAEHSWFSGRVADGGITMLTNDSNDFDDSFGHGTHCAGIVAQSTPDNVQILPVKVLTNRGYGYDSSIYCGILYALEQGADVVSMSLGGSGESWIIDEGIAALTAADIPCIVAAGNEHENAMYHHPASNPDCVTIAAVKPNSDDAAQPDFQLADFSNYGACIDFCAPGYQIQSACNNESNETVKMSGTSMATPFVTAAYANLLSYDPTLSSARIYECLKANATDLGAEGFDPKFGWGLINLNDILLSNTDAPNGTDILPENSAPDTTKENTELFEEQPVLIPPNTTGNSCTIQPDVPFVHQCDQYYFTLEADTRLSLQTQYGQPVSGVILSMWDQKYHSISDLESVDLEAGSHILLPDTTRSDLPEQQEICVLHTEALSIYMAEAEAIDAFYTGSPVTPQVQVRINGKLLHEGIDYTILNDTPLTEVGRYRLQIEGIGRYYDSRSFTFQILPAEQESAPLLNEGSHSAEIETPGSQITYRWIPEFAKYCFTRTDNRPGSIRILDESGNLTASLSGVGSQSIAVDVIPDTLYYVSVSLESPTLTGSFPFSLTSDFGMLADCTVRMPERLAADSGVPEYEIYDGSVRLTEGTDFEVFALGGEKQYGLAVIVFRGVGKYHGMIEQYYEICPETLNPLPEKIPDAFDIAADQNVTALGSVPGTMRLFRFSAPSDGVYRLMLPEIETSGISAFVYDSDGTLLAADQTEYTLEYGEALQILCVTPTLGTMFGDDVVFQLKAVSLSNDTVWESEGVRYSIMENGTACVMDAACGEAGGVRIPDTVVYPTTGETVSVSRIDAEFRAKIADTHTIYGAHGGNMEAYCEEQSLCFAAEILPAISSGDLTGDGIVTAADLLTLNRILNECSGMILNASVMESADCNADGILDMNDMQIMCRLMHNSYP